MLVAARSAAGRCGDGPGDAQAVAETRAAVDAFCGCETAANHQLYVGCALQVAGARIGSGLLPKVCRRSVKRCAAKSVCGRRRAITCCLQRKGKTRCRILKKASRCLAKGGCVGLFTSCCDACTATGCRPLPTTSTTATTSTTSSTITTTSLTVTTTSSTTTTTFGEGQQCLQFATAPDGGPETLPCGGTVTCRLDPAGDQDSFTFAMPIGSGVSISISGSHTPCWQLFDPNGAFVEQPQCDTVKSENGLVGGTFTIAVTENTNQTSDYVLSLQGISESFHCGLPLNLPSDVHMDELMPAGDTDSYNFQANANAVVNVAITGTTNPCWQVFAPDGTSVMQPRCKADGATDVGPLPQTGTYTIVVTELARQATDYTLSLLLVTP